MRILFFIGTLGAGGKERRLVELLSYLKKNPSYNMMVILRRDQIEYPAFFELKIPYKILTHVYKKGDTSLPLKFYKICKEFKPDIVHTWGSMPAFVSLLSIILLKIPHINSQITNAPVNFKKWSIYNIISSINFRFSTVILANSYAGLKVYQTKKRKSKVIYNGINLNRFNNLPGEEIVRKKYKLFSSYIVIMVASFYHSKDYDLFIDVAKIFNNKRNDVTFLAVGIGIHFERINRRVIDERIQNVVFTGKVDDVESIVNIADIGVLFSTNGEGLSNSILEYMALGKPVIANDAGGTNEIVKHEVNGYLITNESPDEIAEIINQLINNTEKKIKMGLEGKKLINESFTIDRMGRELERIYMDYKKNND
jgi:glycosyltransferase involved in cell wall biosynthesis